MTVHNLNDHRAAAQQRKADALRCAIKDEMADETSTPEGLRLLAKAVWLGRDRTEMWARYAALAGVNPPGSSSGDPTDVIRLIAAGLRADADALDAEREDPVLIAQLAASIIAAQAR